MGGRIKATRPGGGISMNPGLNPDQLKLLMTGQEIKNQITHSYDVDPNRKTASGEPETLSGLWDYKVEEAKSPQGSKDPHGHTVPGAGVYESIKKHGYRGEPIVIREYHAPTGLVTGIYDGHHRVASAAKLEEEGQPVHIPVTHDFSGTNIDPWDIPISFSMFNSNK